MGTITQTIEVAVGVEVACSQWAQFETFREFMAGVDNVEQLTDTMLIASGRVTFYAVDAARTEVNVEIQVDPEDFGENVGDEPGHITRTVARELRRFKDFVERGADDWREEVDSFGGGFGVPGLE